jgi:replicative DNA helicase
MISTTGKEMSDQPSFSKFGKGFQEGLCQLILEDRPFADQIAEVLDINFLELSYLRAFVKQVFGYREKYSVHPTQKIMMTVLRSELENETETDKQQVRSYFARICNSEVEGRGYIKEVSLDFCRKQKLKEAMMESVKLLQSSSFDEISSVINTALKLGSDNNFGHDYVKDFEARFQLKARNAISMGWSEMDSLCKGGLGSGELGVVIAPTGAGKSMVLTHLGAQAIKDGKTVVHYTLELSEASIGNRYDSCLTGVPLNDLFQLKELVYEAVQEIEGRLIIKEYPTKSASSRTLSTHLEKLRKRDIKPDIIIVDYGDLLRPIAYQKEKRTELESIYEELRAIAQENKCPVWTASQTNRSGLNAEVITMESISEAFNKCFVADFIFSVSRTVDDKNNNTGRIFVAKNRNGPDGLVYPIFMDPGSVKIKVLQPTGETPGEIIENSAKKQAENLKEKYKNYKENRSKSNNV